MLFRAPSLDETERGVVRQIADLKEKLRWRLHEPRRWVGSLRRLSFARNIQGSNSIEGYEATLDAAAAVAVGAEPLDTSTETRLALEGYRDAITYVLQLASEPDFEYTEQLIKSLHFMMTSYDLRNRPGRWRAGSIFVRNDQTGEIVHEGADLDEVPRLLHELVEQVQGEDSAVPPVVVAGMLT